MFRKSLLAATILISVGVPAGYAQTNTASFGLPQLEQQAASGPNTPEALSYLQKQGVKLTYIGGDGGVRGYLGSDQQGKYQAFYLMPDGVHFIAGIMFGDAGADTTGAQIDQMKARFTALASGQTPQPASDPSVGTVSVGPAEQSVPAPAAPPAPQADSNPPTSNTIENSGGAQAVLQAVGQSTQPALASGSPIFQPQPVAPPASAATTLPTTMTPLVAPPSVGPLHQINMATFNSEIGHAFYFSVGYPNATPVYMIADPQCEYCHAAWAELRPLVVSGRILLHVILIDGLPGSKPYAISIMSEDRPGDAWDDGQGSTPNVGLIPPGPAVGSAQYNQAAEWLQDNDLVALNLGMTKTPFLAYQDASGNLHEIQAPNDLMGFLGALPPSPASRS